MKYRPKHILEYVALRSMALLFNVLPYRAALALGWTNAWLAHHVSKFRVKEAKARIKSVFNEQLSEREIARIAWISWRNTVFNSVEMMRVSKTTRRWINSVSNCQETMRILKEYADTGQGGIIACPHMGNWELAGITTHLYDIPIFNIAAQQRNPLVNRYMTRLRSHTGVETIQRGSGTMRKVIQNLKAGKMLAILPDVRMRTEGLSMSFLGGAANIGTGMALFARHANAPIFPCIVTRIGWTHHKIVCHPPVLPDKSLDKQEDIRRMTHLVMEIIDDAIQKEPEQWFWFNKRWILDPLCNSSKSSRS